MVAYTGNSQSFAVCSQGSPAQSLWYLQHNERLRSTIQGLEWHFESQKERAQLKSLTAYSNSTALESYTWASTLRFWGKALSECTLGLTITPWRIGSSQSKWESAHFFVAVLLESPLGS